MSKQHLVAAFLCLQTVNLFAAAGDENWNQRFSSPISGHVRSLVSRNGEVYAAGNFWSADGTPASHVAKWDGTNWSALNGLIAEMETYSVATNDHGVYIAGPFLVIPQPTGAHFPAVVRWDGTNVSEVGTQFNSLTPFGDGVTAMHGSSSNLYVAGSLKTVGGGSQVISVARWNSVAWQTLLGMPAANTYFEAIAAKGTDIFLAGQLTMGTATNISRWNGTNWLALSTGLNARGRALAVIGNDVYAGGEFTTAGGVSANRIAKWNGTAWSALGSGLNGTVKTLTVIGTDLYVGGDFTTAGGISSPKLAKWNGSAWSAVNVQVTGSVRASTAVGSTLYVGGAIDSVNNTNTGNIFSYSAGSARTLLGGVSGGHVCVLRAIGDDIYAGGVWRNLAGTNCNSIARFDGMTWSALGSGLSNSYTDPVVYDLISRSNEVVVAGLFDTAGGVAVTNVARWNGTSWQKLGNGLGGYGEIFALAQRGDELFAGGRFQTPGPQNIARLSGSTWVSVGGSIPNGEVRAMAVLTNDLYVGGFFQSFPVSGSSHLAKWNGSTWSRVGTGQLNSMVTAMTVVGTNLYVGGYFTSIGGTTYNRIAKWNGSSWSALGSGLNGGVNSIYAVGNDLYVGGFFSSAGGVSANRIARWNGTAWSALGSGVSGTEYPAVRAIVAKGNDLLAGGSFTIAGGLPSYNLAAWRMQTPLLQVAGSIGSITLSWPAGFISYQPQTTPTLTDPTWANMAAATILSNGTFSVTTNHANSAGFFRLLQAP